MFNVVLVYPEIPPNTGNVIRMCANTGSTLHLIKPLGFSLEDRLLRRAGLDYREFADVRVHESFDAFLEKEKPEKARTFLFSARSSSPFAKARFLPGDWFVFGAESKGLPDEILGRYPASQRIRLPMRPGNRSLNLSNTCAVAVYEAWRQNGYEGGI
jgi:tRNA (cytidine/uridine-2'-O-)-methyltransferase